MKDTIKEVSIEIVQNKIYLIRGQKVMIDKDLAGLYGVPTKSLNLAVKRNLTRFPDDFMFKLTSSEVKNLRFQIETSSWGGRRYLPYVFTQEGIAMLSSVLKSTRAIQVNIQIMRTFLKLREFMATHKDLRQKVEEMEKKYDQQFKAVFEVIKKLITYPDEAYKKTKVGFIIDP